MEMFKKVLLISMLIMLYFRNIEAMREVSNEPSVGENSIWTQPINSWKKLAPLTSREMRIYNKTWDYRATLARNKENLTNTFLDICCDFSFKIVRKENEIVYGWSASNPNIIFLKDLATVNSFIRKNSERYAVTNFLNNTREPREFVFEIRELIQNQIRSLAEDSVGCKLLRIATAKIAVGKLPKLIFIPLKNDSVTGGEDGFKTTTVGADGMDVRSGIYGWQIEYDCFISRIQHATTMDRKISAMKNNLFDFQKYSAMKLPIYRYILFSPENLLECPIVSAIKWIGSKLKFFDTQLPPDATLFRTIVRSLNSNNSDRLQKSESRMNIKARLNLGKKKFSQKLSQKFDNVLRILTEADCMTEKLTPQIFKQMRKLGGIKNYASHFVETMSQSVRSEKIENLVSSYFGNDEEYRNQYGLTADGFDPLNESSYLSHRYHWIRVSNAVQPENFSDMYKTFIQEQGDFDLYAYYLSPNSAIKYPEFGFSQYQCADDPKLTEEKTENRYRSMKKNRVRFLSPQPNERSGGFCGM